MAGLPWIELHANLPRHPKSVLLALMLQQKRAWTYMAQLWLWCGENNPSGRFPGALAQMVIEQAAGWDGESGKFAEAAIAVGFFDLLPDGVYEAHGWPERASAHVAKREKDAERQQARRERVSKKFSPESASTGRPRDVRVTSEENPRESRRNNNPNPNPNPNQLPTEAKEPSPPPADDDRTVPVVIPRPPDTHEDGWDGTDFWRWAASRRHASGYPPERQLSPRKLSGWWAEARAVASVKQLKEAFYDYGNDPYWSEAKPKYPFHGFASQWNRFLPEEDANAA